MDAFEYNANPGRVIFGSGTLQKLPDEISRLNLKAPLVLSTPQQISQAERVKDVLKGKVAGIFTEATMHTPTHVTEKALEYAKSRNADLVISIGGGSTIGLGKAISIRTGMPHICIPTTYAGSEMTPILGETADGLKKTRSDPKILPGTVIYDVDLTMTLPPAMSATSGVNAIAHAVEALYARNTNPVINLMAAEGTRALASALPEIVENPTSQSARASALYGAWLCGTCLGSVGMSIHHKLCHTLGGSFNLPHAETHTAVLPHAISYNAPKIPEAMKKLAEALPGSNGDAVQGLNILLSKLQVKRGLKDFGMKEEDIDKAADIAVSNPYWNPREIERAPIRELIRRMATEMAAAPVLSTPDDRILEATEPITTQEAPRTLSDEELSITYDIDRTLKEIREARYRRIALQFPDDMLPDAPRVFQLLSRGLDKRNATDGNVSHTQKDGASTTAESDGLAHSVSQLNIADTTETSPKLYILADTSYGTCCVDEVAAEHVNADVVVHYGRSCLSPTSRLPVIYVFTHKPLPIDPVVRAFQETYPDLTTKVILAADVTYTDHIPAVYSRLVNEGYTNLFATDLVHNPSSAIPNRTVPDSVRETPDSLSEWQLFHISDPPTALLMTLASRVASIHIYPTDDLQNENVKPLPASTAIALRRRYATLTRLSTAPIFGILVNTLSVKNYLHIVEHVKQKIAEAGKKSYMFVVGKLNAAKVANFSEIDGWVVIGCWESSLVDSKDFWKPVITPFELELALQGDAERIWTGAWQSDFQSVLNQPNQEVEDETPLSNGVAADEEEDMSESESAPPEFDLRTGRYVSHSRPMRNPAPRVSASAQDAASAASGPSAARALAKRAKGDLAMIGGTFSPGAEFLRSQRTWKGLGSDFDIQYEEDAPDDTLVVEGRKGIARGYTVGDSIDRH
ncbi:hypothetical protein BDV32DRAFT_141601 [Aspergillus pseudonomiae]|uniref:2-(3-amino-3-carboxypropyl)histidine synthase subunit 2 n=1 Tax=Aspergillus pseudonomiae TaxID=1506151 RepID=A0A5N6HNU1_9EURO|nr:uncharacterized protein BDV37DRAFT_270793 [Aspergillus pseudonomiae]KAB8255938.1 hypothetical protein BDV32DRAFT_141601 [Aspergillus pseudonomiae]KAE8405306.1 hypothetical protein BDV37DRAFT_270793 [Aspergillus pseudonomiae]